MTNTTAPAQIDLHLGFYPPGSYHLPIGSEVEPGVRVGLHPEGMFVFASTPVAELRSVVYCGTPEATVTGIVCGHCSDHTAAPVRHASVRHVEACYDAQVEMEAEARAEAYAEGAWLRHAEGGWDVTGAYAAELWEEERRMVG